MEEVFLKLRIEIDPNADPKPTLDDIIAGVRQLLTVGAEGSGDMPFGVRDVTPLQETQSPSNYFLPKSNQNRKADLRSFALVNVSRKRFTSIPRPWW